MSAPYDRPAYGAPGDELLSGIIEFAPAWKTVPNVVAKLWYAEGWIYGKRFEFSTQSGERAAYEARQLCYRLNTVIAAVAGGDPTRPLCTECLGTGYEDEAIATEANTAIGGASE